MTFSERLKSLRKEHNLTQDDLGKVLNYGRTAISGYESGRNEPSYDVLETLSNYFDVSIDYLLGKTDIRNNKGTSPVSSPTLDKVIKNPDIRRISRAGENMTPEQAETLRKVAEAMFPEAFKDSKE